MRSLRQTKKVDTHPETDGFIVIGFISRSLCAYAGRTRRNPTLRKTFLSTNKRLCIVEINIPGIGTINIKNLLLDYNGTIACDGKIISSVKERIESIHKMGIAVHLVTADTHGTVRNECADMPVQIQIFDNSNAAKNKKDIVKGLEADTCVCIGNGFNDGQMFEACRISIIVIGTEGCSAKSLVKADIVCKSIEDALDLILIHNRIIPTLRG